MPWKHKHRGCVACLHIRAHGMWDGFSLAYAELLKAGYNEAAERLITKQRRIVNRMVRKLGIERGLDNQTLTQLMRHHGERKKP